ncbi:MAG: tetratricopeptide repeat protein [Desulfomonile tiedjei]|nr:tetratricopeptide repeat protein [Desulfomonile tiedjei]
MKKHPELATEANAVWKNAKDIHDHQAPKDGNKNGRDHVETVEKNIWKFLVESRHANGKLYAEVLEPYDLFLLSLSACCHDFDKALGKGLDELGLAHGEGSGEIVIKNREKLGIGSEHVAQAIADIVCIHDCKQNFGDELRGLPRKYTIGGESGDARLLSLLLKAADTLHCDHTRVYEIQVSQANQDDKAKSKALARKSISGWYVEGKTIYVQVNLKTPESAEAFKIFKAGFIRDEWNPIAPSLDGYGLPYKIDFEGRGPYWPGTPSPDGGERGTTRLLNRDDSFAPDKIEARLAEPSRPISDKPLQLVAVPPDRLAEHLCESGKLSVIGNTYVQPVLTTLRSSPGALNCLFVGPADRGKTRCAYEWIKEQVGSESHAWTIIRPASGSIPHDAGKFFIDFNHYYGSDFVSTHAAILFADDLPEYLAPPDRGPDASQAVQRLLGWFSQLPGFTSRRFAGTMRSELTHDKPDWPDSLAALGQLDLLRVEPLDAERRRALWSGLSVGLVSRGKGLEEMDLEIDEGFLDAVTEREADTEAIAYYVRDAALKGKSRIEKADAASFTAKVADIWIRKTWPAVRATYDIAACVFLTIARFIEAGSRPDSGFPNSLDPEWEYHEVFGPPLLADNGGRAEDYLPVLQHMINDGHAIGEPLDWIRPRFDFLLQAPTLGNIELSLPEPSWFARHASDLSPFGQYSMASHLSSADRPFTDNGVTAHWLSGHAWAMNRLAENEPGDAAPFYAAELAAYDDLIARYRLDEAPEVREDVASGMYNKGIVLSNLGRDEDALAAYEEVIKVYGEDKPPRVRKVVAKGMLSKGRLLGKLGRHKDALAALEGLDTRYRNDEWPENLENLAELLILKGLVLGGMGRGKEELEAYEELVARFWDDDAPEVRELAAEGMLLKGLALNRLGHDKEELEAFEELVARFWDDKAPEVRELVVKGMLLLKGSALTILGRDQEAHAAYMKVVARFWDDTAPATREPSARGLGTIASILTRLWRKFHDNRLLVRAVAIGREALAKGAGGYHLACALSLSGELEEAFELLERALSSGEVSWSHVLEDPDLIPLRDDARFRKLEEGYGAEGSEH